MPEEPRSPLSPGVRFVYHDIYGGTVTYRLRSQPLIGGGFRMVLKPVVRLPLPQGLVCKNCGGDDLVRFGTRKGVQRYLCQTCGRTFMDNGALPGMRISPEVIGAAVSMFYGGLSIREVRNNLDQIFDVKPSKSTIYGWLIRYTKKAKKMIGDARPRVGDVWEADETVLKIGGRNTWFWDVIDSKTRFLLATHVSQTRKIRDAETLMRRAFKLTRKPPRLLVTDKLASYIEGIERVFGASSKHVQSGPFKLELSTRGIERFHGSLKDRTKVMRGMADHESAKLITDGWLIYYNYLRGHEGLGGETPARAARIKAPFKNWADVVRMTA
ncbi:MAG: IS6 family transposase [Chloroflexi bacterium]|nr:IS6 family transposase [Chloroflexota bacterium]